MNTLFRSSMIAAVVMVGNAGLYGFEAMKKGSEVDGVVFPGSGSSTPSGSPKLEPQKNPDVSPIGSPREPGYVSGCRSLDPDYLEFLARKIGDAQTKAGEHKNNGSVKQ